jgi:hypothetical protein
MGLGAKIFLYAQGFSYQTLFPTMLHRHRFLFRLSFVSTMYEATRD